MSYPTMEWTHDHLVVPRLQATCDTEAIAALATLLYQHGYVRDTFEEAVLERERTFATGLPTPEIQVAIPHADVEHVIQPAIAIGILDKPVAFGEMGDPESTVAVRIVCMLAVSQSEALVSLLRNLVGILQDPVLLHQIVQLETAGEIADTFNRHLTHLQEE